MTNIIINEKKRTIEMSKKDYASACKFGSEEYKDLWAKPEIKQEHQTDFYIQDDDLVIFFQPYDLSYYARGFVEFRLDLEDLSGYMKEEYRRLID